MSREESLFLAHGKSMTTSGRLLEVRDLATKFYTVDGVVNALNGISYAVDKGECLAIVGESGSGKTVGVLSILRLIPSTPGRIVGGQIIFKGTDLLTLDDAALRKIRGREIAVIFQDPMTSLNPVMRIGAQIVENLQAHESLTNRQARVKAADLLGMVGIPTPAKRLDDYPHQFSGGMRQRVMIAMALLCRPALLFADEPTTALDVTVQAQILDLLNGLVHELNAAVVIVTHDLGVIARLCDRVIVLYGGRIMEEAAIDELFETPRHPYSQGLLAATPRLDDDTAHDLRTIKGTPRALSTQTTGCPFASRCDRKIERCIAETPALQRQSGGRAAACHLVTS